MTVFTLAMKLVGFYKLANPDQGPISIVLQDPMYEHNDWILLRELHHHMGCGDSSTVQFLDDPEALLAINTSSLIVTAFLPTQMPLLQIITELAEELSVSPAAILCDSMELDSSKGEYMLADHESPHVTRFLQGKYCQSIKGFADHRLEPTLHRATYEDTDMKYWLNCMDLFVRKGT